MKTGYIQIFSNQAATFNHPKNYDEKVKVRAFEFSEVPEWVLQSVMFKALTKSNKIRLINGKSDISKIEEAGKIESSKITEAIDTAEITQETATETEKNEDMYANMKNKQLYDLCVERGIDVEMHQSRRYYLDKLNQQ